MKSQILTVTLGLALFVSNLSAGVFSIGGFSFDEKNTVTHGLIAQGSSLRGHSSSRFGMFSPDYISDPNVYTNHFAKFNRSKSIGRLMGMHNKDGLGTDFARAISLPTTFDASPRPNTDRYVLQFAWDEGQTLQNTAGNDFVIFESATWEGFAVAVKKEGSTEFSAYRYQFANSHDELHVANAAAFDLSDFGIADGARISAIRICNLMNSKGVAGADKVDDSTGQGKVISEKDPGYDKAYVLRQKLGGEEFPADQLGADILYVTALHNVEPQKPAAPLQLTPSQEPSVASVNVSE